MSTPEPYVRYSMSAYDFIEYINIIAESRRPVKDQEIEQGPEDDHIMTDDEINALMARF